MERRTWLALTVLLGGCNRSADPERLLPLAVGDWKRGAVSESPGGPEQPGGTVKAWSATYSGPGAIHIRVYEMNSPAGGLDAAQRWKPAADTVIFHHEQYFVTAKWDNVERAELTKFIRALESHIREAR